MPYSKSEFAAKHEEAIRLFKTVPVSIAAKVVTVLNVLLTTVKVVTVRIVPVSITVKVVAAIVATTVVAVAAIVRDTTMTVHKEAIVLVRVPAIMIRMLSIA